MKKLFSIALALLFVAISTYAAPVIGVYADEMATDCAIQIEPYTTEILYVVASWPVTEFPEGITAIEFKVNGLPLPSEYPIGLIKVFPYETEAVIGDIWTDYSLAWNEPVGGDKGWWVIATIEITMFSAIWIAEDTHLLPTAGDSCGCFIVVDHEFEVHDAWGMPSFLRATQELPCGYMEPENESWSDIKVLY